jgi:hypothetical protein
LVLLPTAQGDHECTLRADFRWALLISSSARLFDYIGPAIAFGAAGTMSKQGGTIMERALHADLFAGALDWTITADLFADAFEHNHRPLRWCLPTAFHAVAQAWRPR